MTTHFFSALVNFWTFWLLVWLVNCRSINQCEKETIYYVTIKKCGKLNFQRRFHALTLYVYRNLMMIVWQKIVWKHSWTKVITLLENEFQLIVIAQAIYQRGTKYAFAWLHFHSGPIINVMMNHWFWAVRSIHCKHNDILDPKHF